MLHFKMLSFSIDIPPCAPSLCKAFPTRDIFLLKVPILAVVEETAHEPEIITILFISKPIHAPAVTSFAQVIEIVFGDTEC